MQDNRDGEERAVSLEWCRQLPKCELHAHLSGSVRDETLAEFLRDSSDPEVHFEAEPLLNPISGRSLKQCFALFPLIHKLVNTRERITRIVTEVLEDYESENCMFLELRTTPRAYGESISANDYILCVLGAIAAYHSRTTAPRLACRLILSVSRDAPVICAWKTLELARTLLHLPESHPAYGLLVGLELSGNPAVGKWTDFEPVFQEARRVFGSRLHTSLHFAEACNDEEAHQMLDFSPDRVGHAICMSEMISNRLIEEHIPVEVCISSNMMTLSALSIRSHPAIDVLHPAGHPLCLCCDDRGVFSTSLSKECFLVTSQGGLCARDLINMTKSAIAMSFAPKDMKLSMKHRLEDECSNELNFHNHE